MSLDGAIQSGLLAAVVITHMVAEGRAFHRATAMPDCPSVGVLPHQAHSGLWLASCLGYVAHLAVCIGSAWATPTIGAAGAAAMAIGVVLATAGIFLRCRSIASLGPAFSAPNAISRDLVRSDVFSLVRHPSETGLGLIAAGTTLMAPNVWPILTGGGVVVLMVARVWREEAELAKKFGSAHARYKAEVPALWPSWRRRLR